MLARKLATPVVTEGIPACAELRDPDASGVGLLPGRLSPGLLRALAIRAPRRTGRPPESAEIYSNPVAQY